MSEQDETQLKETETTPTKRLSFRPLNWWTETLSEFWKEFRKQIFAALVGAILALIGGLLFMLWNPVSYRMELYVRNISNIDAEVAEQKARQAVSGTTAWSTPFKNKGDPTQYVVTWDGFNGKACDEAVPEKNPCQSGIGAISARLFAVLGEVNTKPTDLFLPALPGYVEREIYADIDERARSTGVTDWDEDGRWEIFGIADQAAFTSSEHTYNVTLYDTGTREHYQLMVTLSDTSQELVFEGPEDNPNLQKWLMDRFREYIAYSDWTQCTRQINGRFSCKMKPTGDFAHTNYFISRARQQAWLAAHGKGFTMGQLKLMFETGLIPDVNNPKRCLLPGGRYKLVNDFKGPLYINDLTKKKSAVLYLQDGKHHREIPSIFIGREYIWLGLRQRTQLLAIHHKHWAVVGVDVAVWPKSNYGTPIDEEISEGGKEEQVDLEMKAGTLAYGGKSLSLSLNGKPIPASEFSGATTCVTEADPSDDLSEDASER